MNPMMLNDFAEKILDYQMDIEEKKNRANIIIENLSDVKSLKNNFDTFLKQLLVS